MGGLVIVAGGVLGGSGGLAIGLILGLVMVGGSYWFSDKLAIKSARRSVSREQLPQYYEIMEDLTARANMPMPRLYITPSQQPNAFATGRNPNNAAVAVTEGLLQAMNWEQVRGVLAHELAHIRNRDILIGSVAAAIGMGITLAARMVMWGRCSAATTVIATRLVSSPRCSPRSRRCSSRPPSRSREFQADESAARLLGTGEPLAQALQQLESYANRIPAAVDPNQASNYIIDPLKAQARGGQGGGFGKLFAPTHRPTTGSPGRSEPRVVSDANPPREDGRGSLPVGLVPEVVELQRNAEVLFFIAAMAA